VNLRVALALSSCLLAACAPAPASAAEALPNFEAPPSLRAATADGRFEVSVRTAPDPIPLNEPFELFVAVRDRAAGPEGTPGLTVSADGFMPAHGHGMLRAPRSERLADGTWRVRGMLFHMAGAWELRVRLAWREDSLDGESFTLRHEELAFDCEPAATSRDARSEAREFFSAQELQRLLAASPLPPPPADPTNAFADDPAAAELGRALFYDERLSGDGTRSCASCHDPQRGWSDGLPTAVGRQALDAHTPTLWNAAYQRWLFWDGRADSLWAQALQPIEGERELGGSREAVAALLAADPQLGAAWVAAFGSAAGETDVDTVFANVGKALAAFERRIVTGETPFDRFARGLETGDARDLAALGEDARAGAKLFFGRARCHLCHQGPAFSDLEFHDVRVPVDAAAPPPAGRYAGIGAVLADPFNGLGAFSDDAGEASREKLLYLARTPHARGEFKTPGLRNVALAAPYMHAGQYATLAEVVAHYATLEDAAPVQHPDAEDVLIPLNLTAREQAQLVEFLNALTSGPPPVDLLDPERQPEG